MKIGWEIERLSRQDLEEYERVEPPKWVRCTDPDLIPSWVHQLDDEVS